MLKRFISTTQHMQQVLSDKSQQKMMQKSKTLSIKLNRLDIQRDALLGDLIEAQASKNSFQQAHAFEKFESVESNHKDLQRTIRRCRG